MPKDRLFLLAPGFLHAAAGPDTYYCPECATLEGVLAYYPALRERIDVQRIAFPRPRAILIELLGEELQGAPVLVLGAVDHPASSSAPVAPTGRRYLAGLAAIADYFAERDGIARLHP